MVVSSARDADVVRSAVAQGAVQYVIKPFAFGALRDRLLAYQEFRRAGRPATPTLIRPRWTGRWACCGRPAPVPCPRA